MKRPGWKNVLKVTVAIGFFWSLSKRSDFICILQSRAYDTNDVIRQNLLCSASGRLYRIYLKVPRHHNEYMKVFEIDIEVGNDSVNISLIGNWK